jgi:AcrR family transcriptional regulator
MPNACAAARTMNADKVLDVAVTAYWQGDPADMSMNTICQMAGVSSPSVYHEFGSEDGMTCATLNRDAVQVLSDIFAILHRGAKLEETLNALNEMGAFACSDPRMKTRCLFYKLRAGRYRLGPETRTPVEEIDAAGKAA